MPNIVTFGERMLRLQPYNYERFVQCDHVEFTFGGGEANVAVSLANYEMDAAFVTKLPDHVIGQAAINSLLRFGSAFTLMKKALRSAAVSASMTGLTPPLLKQTLPILSGIAFSMEPTGSISPSSPRL